MEKMEVVLMWNGKPHKVVLPDLVAISDKNINRDVAEHAGRSSFYGQIYADATAARDNASQSLKDTRASVDMAVRETIAKTGEKSTEASIAAKIELHKDYMAAKKVLADAEQNAARAQQIVRAWDQRKEMLITLGANLRTEIETGIPIVIKDRQ